MYICRECGRSFETPENLPVMSGEFWGRPFTEYADCCPYCKLDNIVEIKFHCDCCGCSICEGETYYSTQGSNVFCEECIEKKEA